MCVYLRLSGWGWVGDPKAPGSRAVLLMGPQGDSEHQAPPVGAPGPGAPIYNDPGRAPGAP